MSIYPETVGRAGFEPALTDATVTVLCYLLTLSAMFLPAHLTFSHSKPLSFNDFGAPVGNRTRSTQNGSLGKDRKPRKRLFLRNRSGG